MIVISSSEANLNEEASLRYFGFRISMAWSICRSGIQIWSWQWSWWGWWWWWGGQWWHWWWWREKRPHQPKTPGQPCIFHPCLCCAPKTYHCHHIFLTYHCHIIVIKPFCYRRSHILQGRAGLSTSSLSQSAIMDKDDDDGGITDGDGKASLMLRKMAMMALGNKKMLTSRVMNSSLMRKSWIFLMSIPSFTWTFIIYK